MSAYLARLKVIETGKIFCNTPEMEVPKVPKAPFDTFDTSVTGEIEKKNINSSYLKIEQRREKVLKILADNPASARAIITDLSSDDPSNVIIIMAIRGVASFQMQIPKHKYDAFLMLEIIERGAALYISH